MSIVTGWRALMSDRKGMNLFAVILGCSMLAAGTTVTFAASDSSTASSDSEISHQVLNKLTREMPENITGLKVETQDGVVTLSGRAHTETSKLRAAQDARRVPGVTDVKDNLRVTM